ADYAAKLSTLMAGDDLPDIICFLGALSGATTILSAVPGGYQFLQAKATDLTPYLAGDAAKAYSNLAATPTYCWTNSGCAYQGKLYMIPFHRNLAANLWIKNATIFDAKVGKDYVPKKADDFKRVLQELTQPQQNVWGIGGGTPPYVQHFAGLFGAPNEWRRDPNGNLTRMYETPEFKEAIGYMRDLWSAGVFHPDSPTPGFQTGVAFLGGRITLLIDSFNTYQSLL